MRALLTRITTTNEVPSRKPIVLDSKSPKPVVKLVYSRKPRKNKNAESVSNTKVLKPLSANKQEPIKSPGDPQKTNIPSYLLNEAGCPNRPLIKSETIKFAKIMGLRYQIRNVPFQWAKVLRNLTNPNLKTPIKKNSTVAYGSMWSKRVASVVERSTILVLVMTTLDLLGEKACIKDQFRPLHDMNPVTISSGLMPNPPSSTPFVPPSRSEWDLLFQPMFDESLTPPPYVDLQAPKVIAPEAVAPEHVVSTGSPSSTTVDQDAPSPSTSHTTQGTQTPIISHDIEEDNHDIKVAHMGNDPYFDIPIPEVPSDQSLSDVIHTIVHPDHQVSEYTSKWMKDHPLENIIGALDRLVSTRLQLHEQALFCYYDAFLTSVKPKNYKEALTKACWIEAMQEELREFECLEVWELVPPPDKAFVISLKWIY
ncbi:retrovirus-related pol polyprotein from transposon TNT 1-94, partial [Tanacetum coccineum]